MRINQSLQRCAIFAAMQCNVLSNGAGVMGSSWSLENDPSCVVLYLLQLLKLQLGAPWSTALQQSILDRIRLQASASSVVSKCRMCRMACAWELHDRATADMCLWNVRQECQFYANMRLSCISNRPIAAFFAYFFKVRISHICPHRLAFFDGNLNYLCFYYLFQLHFVTLTIWQPTEWHQLVPGPLWNEMGQAQLVSSSFVPYFCKFPPHIRRLCDTHIFN